VAEPPSPAALGGPELSDANFRRIFHYLPIPTIFLGPDKRVLAMSESFLQHYGLQSHEALGLKCYEVFRRGKAPCPPHICSFAAAMHGQKGLFNLHQYKNAQGNWVVEEVHLSPFTEEDGRPLGVIESVRDISEAKRLEISLTETNELLGCLLNSMVGVVVAADLADRILFVNHNSQAVMGYPPEELAGQGLWEFSPPAELARLHRTLEQSQGPVRGLRSSIVKRDGESIPVKVNLNYIYRDGAPIGTLFIISDIRERMKIERHLTSARMQVMQSDKLAVLGRMAAGVAHELNNPLTGITIYGELVRENLPLDHPAQADLKRIVDDADRCRDIVRDLLDYSRQSNTQVEALDLSLVVEEALSLIPQDSLGVHVRIVSELAPEPLIVQSDRKLLRQVFINLISNAFDAMDGRGTLTVRTYQDGQGLRCAEIADTGGGISPEHMAKIFDPFFTTKPPGQGTGLGLSVVFGVIARHDGKIMVKETGPQGTTFLVQLPAQAPKTLQKFSSGMHEDDPDSEEIG
jgi:PAS domain S-box-containing protein